MSSLLQDAISEEKPILFSNSTKKVQQFRDIINLKIDFNSHIEKIYWVSGARQNHNLVTVACLKNPF